MTRSLRHRGPDGAGVYLDDDVALGHARLSIIDLAGGAQPIHNEDRTLWIVYNGETFNYPELRRDLEGKGHIFYTSTDTEVVLHLYEELGPSCLEVMNGQFAFAVWDAVKKELFLARDRIGILPLHYMEHAGRFLFASEIKSLFSLPGVPRRLDPRALDQVFTFWTTLPGRTSFQGVSELPPGHWLTVRDGRTSLRSYWDLSFAPRGEQFSGTAEQIGGEIRGLLEDAIRIRLRADVAVGSYLSGGLDSSAVTALVRQRFDNRLRTFGIRFEEEDFDEGEYQDDMVSFLGTDHTEALASNGSIGAHLSEVLWHCEKPLLRTAPVPLFLLAEAVKNNSFKVVLTGEGADEVFGGYNIFRETKVRRFWAREPTSAWRPLLIGRLYPYILNNSRRYRYFVQSFFGRGLDRPDDPFFSHLVRWEGTAGLKRFFSPGLKETLGDYDGREELKGFLPAAFDGWDSLARAQYLETKLFLSNYLLSSQGDRVAMAHGVEIRPPYLDHRIVEYMGNVPSRLKIRTLDEKYILKKSMAAVLPEKIIRRPKHPYRAPIAQSLLNGQSPGADEMLGDAALEKTGLFDAAKVRKLLAKLRSSSQVSEFDNMALVGIASTQIISDRFEENYSPESEEEAPPGLVFDRRSSR